MRFGFDGDPPVDATPQDTIGSSKDLGADDAQRDSSDSPDGQVILPDGTGCPAGLTVCSGACVDLQTNMEHCGECERPCSGVGCATYDCIAGSCATATTAGCTIDDQCIPDGSLNPNNPCEICDIASPTAWQPVGPCVSTLAGSGQAGLANGAAQTAKFFAPSGVAVDAVGKVYVADRANHCIREISGGTVSTFAGTGIAGYNNGPVASAQFNSPESLAVGTNGELYVADTGNHRIRVIDKGTVSTLAGSNAGFADGTLGQARFSSPGGITVDSIGRVYVADTVNHRIRVIDGSNISTLAGQPSSGLEDGPVAIARFNLPADVAVTSESESPTVYVADMGNNRIRAIGGDGMVGTLSSFVSNPEGVAVNSLGAVLVAVTNNYQIAKIEPPLTLTVLAGVGGSAGWADGPAATALFGDPAGIAVDAGGVIYIADRTNNRIRRYTP